jgi:hypothetical protein
MITFESEYKSFNQRLFTIQNLAFLIEFIIYSSLIIFFNLSKIYTVTIGLFLFAICGFIIINRSKNNVDLITFEENRIILSGETFNTKWLKSLNIKETSIEIQSSGSSRVGLSGANFYLKVKNKEDNYIINSFETYSDEGIIQIFNEFKKFKEEKIIVDERLVLLRIQEKIEKCQ